MWDWDGILNECIETNQLSEHLVLLEGTRLSALEVKWWWDLAYDEVLQ